MRRLLRSLAAIPFVLAALWLGAALALEFFPTRGENASGPVEIFVIANGYHAEFVLPQGAGTTDWREFLAAADFAGNEAAGYVAFGWGDGEFFMTTPRLRDARLVKGVRALLALGEPVLHVTFTGRPVPGESVRLLQVSHEQLAGLEAFLLSQFPRDSSGRPMIHAGRSYGHSDAFFRATGSYSLMRTCNEWIGEGLRAAGVPTGRWTPLARNLMVHL